MFVRLIGWTVCWQWQKQETKDLQEEYTRERDEELEIIRDLTKELKRLQFMCAQVC